MWCDGLYVEAVRTWGRSGEGEGGCRVMYIYIYILWWRKESLSWPTKRCLSFLPLEKKRIKSVGKIDKLRIPFRLFFFFFLVTTYLSTSSQIHPPPSLFLFFSPKLPSLLVLIKTTSTWGDQLNQPTNQPTTSQSPQHQPLQKKKGCEQRNGEKKEEKKKKTHKQEWWQSRRVKKNNRISIVALSKKSVHTSPVRQNREERSISRNKGGSAWKKMECQEYKIRLLLIISMPDIGRFLLLLEKPPPTEPGIFKNAWILPHQRLHLPDDLSRPTQLRPISIIIPSSSRPSRSPPLP